MKRVIVIGGGTFSPIRNHLSLCAPAFGNTAKMIFSQLDDSELVLTKMADPNSKLVTNNDIEEYIDKLLDDENVGTIILNAALCDYDGKVDNVESGFHAERLQTSEGDNNIHLTPANKIIGKIRIKRPDIFLIGFKTTTNKSQEDQFAIALKMMKKTKCNLVLANDTVTRRNMIITPEETIYGNTENRKKAIEELCEMISMRNNLTYKSSNLRHKESVSMMITSTTFQEVIQYLIDNGGFIENNGNGFTPGHFCQKLTSNVFLSSQRKVNHNDVFDLGLTKVVYDTESGEIHSFGERKPSVGAQSQLLLLLDNPEYDCIVHTHNPLKFNSLMPIAEQKPFQCGSLECGLNTKNNIVEIEDGIKAVYLNKHGANILFKSSLDSKKVIDFIEKNIELGIKTI